MKVTEEIQRARGRAGEFGRPFHRLQRLAVDEDQATPPEIIRHVVLGVIDPVAVIGHIVQCEWVIATGKERGLEMQLPRRDRLVRLRVEAEVPAFAGLPAGHDGGAFHLDFRAGRGLVADHGVRARPAAGRLDRFAINTRCNDDSLARQEYLGRMIDRAERMILCARAVVIGILRLVVHIIGFAEMQWLFPHGKLSAVGQARVIGESRGRSQDED